LSEDGAASPARRGLAAVGLLAAAFVAGLYFHRLGLPAPAVAPAVVSTAKPAAQEDDRRGDKPDDDEGPTVTLDPVAQQRAGILARIVPVRRIAVTMPALGSVVDLQPLIEMADNLASARTQLAVARARLDAARAAFERARASLAAAGNVSAAQVEAAEAIFKAEQAGEAGAQAHADTLVASAGRAWGPVLGRALAERNDAVLRLLDRRETLLQVSIAQGDRLEHPPRGAELLDGSARVPLRFVSWAPKADPRLPGASLLFAAASRDALVPGATWPVQIALPTEVQGGIVPTSAIVWSQGHAWFFVRSGEKRFERHPLGATATATAGGFVVPEVDDDDEIVIQGAQTLLSEEQRGQIDLDETGGR
jgi:hypothetical protein